MMIKLLVAALVMCAVWTTGGLFEKNTWLYWLEYLRLPLTWAVVCFLLSTTPYLKIAIIGGAVLLIISYLWLWQFNNAYLNRGISNNVVKTS